MSEQKDAPGTLDLIIEEIGQWGKYNIINYVLILVPIFFTGLYGSAYIFTAGDIEYRCQIPECEGLDNADWLSWAIPSSGPNLEKCKRFTSLIGENESDNDTVVCSAAAFDNDSITDCREFVYGAERTIVKDFNLGCQEWKRTMVGSIHNAGLFFSIALTGLFSDRFGRKTCLVVTGVLNGIMGFIRSFSVNYKMFLVFEFLEPALGGGLYTCAFILAMETVSPKNRVLMNALINMVFTTGLISLAGISWLTQDWKIILKILYIPIFLIVIYYWLMDESVRWLLAKGRNQDAVNILKKAADINNVKISDVLLVKLRHSTVKYKMRHNSPNGTNPPPDDAKLPGAKSKFHQFLGSPILIQRVLCCAFLWTTCTFTYYGLSINSVSLSGNKHMNYVLVCLAEFPSHVMAIFVVDRIGRRKTMIVTFIFGGACCVASAFIPEGYSVISLILYLLGKVAITLAYFAVYVYVSEVFPTSLRQSLLGVCSTLGRFGSLVAPQVPLMAFYVEALPSILFGSLALASGIISFTMPETANTKLPDTIEEAENIRGKS